MDHCSSGVRPKKSSGGVVMVGKGLRFEIISVICAIGMMNPDSELEPAAPTTTPTTNLAVGSTAHVPQSPASILLGQSGLPC